VRTAESAAGSTVTADAPRLYRARRGAGAQCVFSVDQLLNILQDNDTRRWVSYILGSQPPQIYINQIETLRQVDPEVYFAVTVLWQIMNSWVYNLEMYG